MTLNTISNAMELNWNSFIRSIFLVHSFSRWWILKYWPKTQWQRNVNNGFNLHAYHISVPFNKLDSLVPCTTTIWHYPNQFLSISIYASAICINALNVSNFNLVCRWLFIKFCSEKPLSHYVVLEGITISVCQSLFN